MFWVFLLLIAAPLLELYVAIQVAHVIGGWNTIAALILVGIIGTWLLKWQGIAVLNRVRRALMARRMPDAELVDGFLLVVAAGLMIAPGFVGDVIGLFLLFPPTRALVRPFVQKRMRASIEGRVGSFGGTRFIGTFRVDEQGRGHSDIHDVSGRDNPTEGPKGQIEP